jgi:Flagellar biosynthesis protein, FliO
MNMLSKNIFGGYPAGEIRPGAEMADPAFQSARGNGLWWQRLLRLGRRPMRRLRLCESLALGERRFVAVIEFEQSRFLVGGTSTSLVLLARLHHGDEAVGRMPSAPEPIEEAATPEEKKL